MRSIIQILLILLLLTGGGHQHHDGGGSIHAEERKNQQAVNRVSSILGVAESLSSPVLAQGESKIPEELIGAWRGGKVSDTSYLNRNNGSYSSPSGTIVRYTFFKDGSYINEVLIQSSMSKCTTSVFIRVPGMLEVEGKTLTLDPQPGKLISKDNCRAQFNYEKEVPPSEAETYRWRIEEDQYGTKLCLQNGKINDCVRKE